MRRIDWAKVGEALEAHRAASAAWEAAQVDRTGDPAALAKLRELERKRAYRAERQTSSRKARADGGRDDSSTPARHKAK